MAGAYEACVECGKTYWEPSAANCICPTCTARDKFARDSAKANKAERAVLDAAHLLEYLADLAKHYSQSAEALPRCDWAVLGTDAAELAGRLRGEPKVASSFGGVSPCRPPQASEPPFQQCSVRICRVCGLEYFETPCLQTHICHACRLPEVKAQSDAGGFWKPIATVPCDGAVYLFVNSHAEHRLPWLGCNPRYFYGPDTRISGPSGYATHWAPLPPLPTD